MRASSLLRQGLGGATSLPLLRGFPSTMLSRRPSSGQPRQVAFDRFLAPVSIAMESLCLPLKGPKLGKAHEVTGIRGYNCDS